MSSWSEAVWVVKKLQKNFDFSSEITYYTQNLNTLNGRVNALNSTVIADAAVLEGLDTQIDDMQDTLNTRCTTISAKSVNGLPQGYDSSQYSKGTIWLIQK